MSLNPHIIPTGGIDQRVMSSLADLQRQMQQAIANMNEIPAQSISGGGLTGQIKATTITSAEIAAGAIVAGTIAAGAVTAGTIAAGAINSNSLFVSGVIQASSIQANTITASQIQAHTITSTELTSTAIDGMTITGSVFRTSAGAGITGAGVVIDASGVRGYSSGPLLKFNLDSTTGLINAQGVILAQAGSSLPVSTITGYLPAGANRYSNSAFQNGASTFDTTGWTISNAASSGSTTITPVYGALTMKLITSASGNVFVAPATATDPYRRVLAGINYTFSHYVYPTTVARQSQINVQWYDSAGSALSSSSGTATNTVLNQYTRIAQTFTAPANAAYAQAIHYVGISSATSDVCYVECFQMEEGDRASAWSPRPDEILVNQINAVNINVANLSAISANLGAITAGTITGTTITGGTIQTASGTGARVSMEGASNALRVYDSGNVQRLSIDGVSGIRLPQGSASIESIEWLFGSNPVGIIQATGNGIQSNIKVTAMDSSGAVIPSVLVLSRDNVTNSNNFALIQVNDAASVNSYSRTIVDGTGASNFLQNASGAVAASHVGDPMFAYGTADAAWSLNTTFNPLVAMGATVNSDPGSRKSGSPAGSQYTCRNTGYYLVSVSASWSAGTDAVGIMVGVQNATSGYFAESDSTVRSAIAFCGHSIMVIVPATAGDILQPLARTQWTGTIKATGLGGGVCTHWSVVQVM